jgi:hypothetical protein
MLILRIDVMKMFALRAKNHAQCDELFPVRKADPTFFEYYIF